MGISEKAWSTLWESAYRRFETPEEENCKFPRRLLKLEAPGWPRNAPIIELLFVGISRSHSL